MLGELQRLRRDVTSAAEIVAPVDTSYELSLKKQLRILKHTEHLDGSFVGDMTENLRAFSNTMDDLRTASESASHTLQVLKTLYFPSITTRQRKIPEAHAKTFTWAYKSELPDGSQKINFVDWLRTEKGVFWVQGKPGSGKSTLMKFLASNGRTVDGLKQWAAGKQIKVAGFFFWHAGSALQKSQEGLLRSLLFEILRQCPDLEPKVTELRSKARQLHHDLGHLDDGGPWTCDELLFVCCHIGTYAKDAKFMLFIDGLDEYEEDHMAASDLIETVKRLGCAPNIKLCVSSRPWGVFLDAFGHDDRLTLKLEDLTRNDIRHYITDKFNENRQYRRLKVLDPTYTALVEEVCKRAQGVFLWVYLAVRNLLDGVANADSASFLHTRLDSFPPELEDFFQHMIDTIPMEYRAQTARIFDIAKLAPEPQSMIAYSFVHEVEENPRLIHQMEIGSMEDAEVRRREDQVKRQLYARCMGLLEVTSDEQHQKLYYQLKVDFLHRTVSEFLHRQSSGLTSLLGPSQETSTPAAVMSRALVGQLKNAPSFVFETLDEHSGPSRMIENLLEFVSRIEPGDLGSKETIEILGVAESAFKGQRLRQNSAGLDQQLDEMRNTATFIVMCCQKRLSPYVRSRYLAVRSAFEEASRLVRPPLDYALEYRDGFVDPDTVRVLLELGADPNQEYGLHTVWQRFLRQPDVRSKLGSDPETQQVIKLLVQHKANVAVEIRAGHFTKEGEPIRRTPRFDERRAAQPIRAPIQEPEPPLAWELIKGTFSEVEQKTILCAAQRWALRRKRFSKLKNTILSRDPWS